MSHYKIYRNIDDINDEEAYDPFNTLNRCFFRFILFISFIFGGCGYLVRFQCLMWTRAPNVEIGRRRIRSENKEKKKTTKWHEEKKMRKGRPAKTYITSYATTATKQFAGTKSCWLFTMEILLKNNFVPFFCTNSLNL